MIFLLKSLRQNTNELRYLRPIKDHFLKIIRNTPFPISAALLKDASELTELTRRSKAYWGYSAEHIRMWHDDLLVTESYIDQHYVYLVRHQGTIKGYYSYIGENDAIAKLDNLFIDPLNIGSGLGKQLMHDFLDRVRTQGSHKATLDSEPQAEAFYQKFGFRTVDHLESAIPGRSLPVMELAL